MKKILSADYIEGIVDATRALYEQMAGRINTDLDLCFEVIPMKNGYKVNFTYYNLAVEKTVPVFGHEDPTWEEETPRINKYFIIHEGEYADDLVKKIDEFLSEVDK
jgi:hypothetical protein